MILSGPLKPGTEEVGRPRGWGLQRRGRSVRTSPVPLGSGPDAPALAPLTPARPSRPPRASVSRKSRERREDLAETITPRRLCGGGALTAGQ